VKICVVDSGLKKWSSAISVDSIVAPVITSPATIAITPTDDVHITLTGGTSFVHIESVGAGAGIQFDRPNTSDAGSMITWQTNSMQKWELGPLGDGTDNFRLYNTVAGANAISVNQSTNVTTIASLTLGAALPVASGGTGQTSYTNGQLLIGNTTGNTLTKATLTGTSNQVVVTNGTGSITLSLPQSIATTSTPQFAKIGIGAAAHATSKIYATDSSSNVLLVETTGASSQAGLKCSLMNGASPVRAFTFSIRGDLDAAGSFCIADETAAAIRMTCDQNGWFGFGGTGLSRVHAVENSATASERGIISEQFLNGTTAGTFIGRKARTSGGNRAAISTAGPDILAEYKSQGHDGTGFIDAGKIQFISTGTIGTNRIPCELVLFTSTDASTSVVTEAIRFSAAQNLVFNTNATIQAGATDKCAICCSDLTGGQRSFYFQAEAGNPIILGGAGNELYGNTSSAGTFKIYSTSHATKGKILFGTSAYDEANNRLGVATASPSDTFSIAEKTIVNSNGLLTKYNNVTTAGFGVPAICGQGRFTAQTAAKATVATYTVGAADGSFYVSANVLVTTSTLHNFTVTVSYTDEGNTARTLTLNFSTVGGAIATAIANAGGAVPYEGIPLHIRAKAATSITIGTTGTFTTVTYNVEGLISQAA